MFTPKRYNLYIASKGNASTTPGWLPPPSALESCPHALRSSLSCSRYVEGGGDLEHIAAAAEIYACIRTGCMQVTIWLPARGSAGHPRGRWR